MARTRTARGSGTRTSSKERTRTGKARAPSGMTSSSSRKKSTAKTKASPGVGRVSRALARLRPLALLAAVLLCVYAAVAFATYNPLDPSFTRASGSTVTNAAGPIGAWVADLSFQILGYGAWGVIPLAVLLSLKLARRPVGGVGRFIGGGALTWALLGMMAALWPALPGADFPAGGLAGEVTVQTLRGLVGPAGTWILLVGAALAAVPFVAPLHLEDLAARLVGGVEGAAPRVGRVGLTLGKRAVGSVAAAGAAVAERVREARAEEAEGWDEDEDSFPGDRLSSVDSSVDQDATGASVAGDGPSVVLPPSVVGPSMAGPAPVVRPSAGAFVDDRATAWSDGGAAEPRLAAGLASQAGLPQVTPITPTHASGRALVEAEWEPTVPPSEVRDTIPAADLAAPVATPATRSSVDLPEDHPPSAVTQRPVDAPAAAVAASPGVVHTAAPVPSSPWDAPEPRSLSSLQPQPAPAPRRPVRSNTESTDSRRVAVSPGHLVSGGDEAVDNLIADPATHAFELPHLGLLDTHERDIARFDEIELQHLAQTLEGKLADFGVKGEVVAIRPGPVVTTFEYVPAPGIKISKISGLSDDIAMALKALRVRIVAPIPGKGVVGIEIPNKKRQVVWLRDMLASEAFRKHKGPLPMALGKTVEGKPYIGNLASMPHLLVGGTTGSGKSVGVNGMLLSMLYTRTPEELRMILIDPKMLEFELYRDIPHLLHPVVTEPKLASAALRWACTEMDERYRTLSRWGVRNIAGYNKKVERELDDWTVEKAWRYAPADWPGDEPPPLPSHMPYIVIVIDELADLMMVAAKDVEESIIRLAQKARAAGIHLIVATQRPSVNVITGLIKANMPSRVAFQVRTKVDGRTILDQNGAENLLGKGDQLFLPPGVSDLVRLHGPFCSDDEVRRVTDFLRDQGSPTYEAQITAEDEDAPALAQDDYDDLYDLAVAYVCRQGKASSSMIQREFKIGYNRAARMLELMEREGVVGPADGARPREILVASHAS